MVRDRSSLHVAAVALLLGLLFAACTAYRPFEDLCYRQCDDVRQSQTDRDLCRAKCRDDRVEDGVGDGDRDG